MKEARSSFKHTKKWYSNGGVTMPILLPRKTLACIGGQLTRLSKDQTGREGDDGVACRLPRAGDGASGDRWARCLSAGESRRLDKRGEVVALLVS